MAMLKDACPEISVFEITLLQPQGIYQAGQLLQGYVTLVLTAPLTLHGLHLRYVGGANTEWMQLVRSRRAGRNRRRQILPAVASEIYFDKYERLLGLNPNEAAPHNLEPCLDPGNYRYPFELNVPINIPGTFMAQNGRVCYTIEAIVSRPWSADVKCIASYTVIPRKHLDNSHMGPVRGERSWTPGLCGCLSQPITAWLETNKKGYVAGEHIVLRGEVVNSSNKKINLCTVSLQMIITFTGLVQGGIPFTTNSTSSLNVLTRGRIRQGESVSWNGEQILVPPAIVSSVGLSSIIDIRYAVEMQVYMNRSMQTSLSIPLHIIIGSAPA